jgi:hypothetical protein
MVSYMFYELVEPSVKLYDLNDDIINMSDIIVIVKNFLKSSKDYPKII